MTEAGAGDTDLARVLALVASPCNQRGREQLLQLLPGSLPRQVAEGLRRVDELIEEARGVEPGIVAALQLDRHTEPEPQQEGHEEADVEAFFADGEPTADDTEAETSLPEALLARLLQIPSAEVAAGLLADLPLRMQGASIELLATSTPTSVASGLTGEERAVFGQLRDQLATGRERWGVEAACDILRGLTTTARLRRALTAAAEVDEEAATIIQNHLFGFDDLLRLRDVELQVLLGRIDNATLAKAMVGCDDPVRERVLHNASDRRVALLADESELYAEITSEEIQEARSEVLSVIRLLYERGSITTYFGSISTATASEGEWEEEEADESDAGSGEPEAPPSPAESRPKRRRGRLILGAICGSAAALAIVSLALMLGRGPAPRSRSQPVSASAAGPRGQVLMQSQPTEADSRAEAEEPKPSVAAVPRLSAGQALEVAEDAEAILEFPSPTGTTAAQVRVSGGSTVEGVGPSASDSTVAAGLYLRTGRITVTVLDEGFVVRTPLVSSLTGGRQTQYSVRVVLDATTTVFTRRGEVAVVRQGGELLPKLRQGEQVVLEPSGRMRLSR